MDEFKAIRSVFDRNKFHVSFGGFTTGEFSELETALIQAAWMAGGNIAGQQEMDQVLADREVEVNAQKFRNGEPNPDYIELPSFDDVEAAGLDGTLRTQNGTGPEGTFTWEDIERIKLAREEAALALAGAVDALKDVLRDVEENEVEFSEYPSELPSFDELVFALAGVQIAGS